MVTIYEGIIGRAEKDLYSYIEQMCALESEDTSITGDSCRIYRGDDLVVLTQTSIMYVDEGDGWEHIRSITIEAECSEGQEKLMKRSLAKILRDNNIATNEIYKELYLETRKNL